MLHMYVLVGKTAPCSRETLPVLITAFMQGCGVLWAGHTKTDTDKNCLSSPWYRIWWWFVFFIPSYSAFTEQQAEAGEAGWQVARLSFRREDLSSGLPPTHAACGGACTLVVSAWRDRDRRVPQAPCQSGLIAGL